MSSRIGPYEVISLLKGGGQGQVYLGLDRRLSREVAIKVYDLPEDRDLQRKLMDRARLVASIQSPRVVQVHDVIASSEHLALVMEYVPGCDLEAALALRRPSIAAVLAIATQVVAAIAAARQRQVVHGDIKAANLLLNPNGQVKLTDFGIARPIGEAAAGEGSPVCLAPEQALGGTVDSRTDLFALGCLLYRMLTGLQPFWSGDGLDLEALLYRTPAPVISLWDGEETLPGELAELIASLLQKHPGDRPASTHVVRQALRDIAGKLPLAAGNPVLDFAGELLLERSTPAQPPRVPVGLRARRSILDTGPLSRLRNRHWRFAAPGQRLLRVCLALTVLLAVTLLSYRFLEAPATLLLQPPLLREGSASHAPVSPGWLSTQLEAGLVERIGAEGVLVSEKIRPRPVVYREGREPRESVPRKRLRLVLDCRPLACLLELQLSFGTKLRQAQALVLASESRAAWRREVDGLLDAVLAPDNASSRYASWSVDDAPERRDGRGQQQL